MPARSKPKRPRVRFTFRVDADMFDWLVAQADARDVSVNLLIERAVDHYREIIPPPPPAPGSVELLDEVTAAFVAGK